jgi:hypothetical protein
MGDKEEKWEVIEEPGSDKPETKKTPDKKPKKGVTSSDFVTAMVPKSFLEIDDLIAYLSASGKLTAEIKDGASPCKFEAFENERFVMFKYAGDALVLDKQAKEIYGALVDRDYVQLGAVYPAEGLLKALREINHAPDPRGDV